MDFGIARAITDSGATVTQTGTVLGTANYLSPEQAQGLPVDARSDVYSVGVVLYEMLTGQVPFKADTAVAIAYKHVREAPKPPSQLNPDISPALDAVVLKTLAKNPDNRYQSAEELRLDLQRLLAGQAVEATPIMPADLPTDQTVAMAPATREREATTVIPAVTPPPPPGAPPARRGLVFALLLVMIAAILVGAGALAYNVLAGRTRPVVVPNVVDLSLPQALDLLSAHKLKGVNDGTAYSDTIAAGNVVTQSVQDGTKAQPNTTVLLTVSKGQQTGSVPDVTNKSVDDAKNVLTAGGWTVGTVNKEFSNAPQGQVTRTDPVAGSAQPKSKPVNIYYSGGQQPGALSDVIGQPQTAAQGILRDEGFNPVQISGCDAAKAQGVVLQQNPAGGQQVPRGSDVTITVNQAKQIPNVVGFRQADAINTLTQAGFTYQVQNQTQLFATGTVVKQSPDSTQVGCPGSLVTITVAQGLGQSASPAPGAT
jgi:serine/threonine-protein kinase